MQRHGSRARSTRADGLVTAEIALGLPALCLVLAACVWLLGAVAAQMRCQDLAREAARALVRGDSEDLVRARVVADRPTATRLSVARTGDLIRAEVTMQVRAGPRALRLPAVTVAGLAVGAAEPGAPLGTGAPQ